MTINTTNLPVNLAGEVHRNHYLRNSKRMTSVSRPLTSLPEWARNMVKSLLSDSEPYYGLLGSDMVVITQNDGDMLLVIFDFTDEVLYWNDDAKKDYGWQREN
jgi:hypothetical protein